MRICSYKACFLFTTNLCAQCWIWQHYWVCLNIHSLCVTVGIWLWVQNTPMVEQWKWTVWSLGKHSSNSYKYTIEGEVQLCFVSRVMTSWTNNPTSMMCIIQDTYCHGPNVHRCVNPKRTAVTSHVVCKLQTFISSSLSGGICSESSSEKPLPTLWRSKWPVVPILTFHPKRNGDAMDRSCPHLNFFRH